MEQVGHVGQFVNHFSNTWFSGKQRPKWDCKEPEYELYWIQSMGMLTVDEMVSNWKDIYPETDFGITTVPSSTPARQQRFSFVGPELNAHLLRANTIAYTKEHSPPEVVSPVPMRGGFHSGADVGVGGQSPGSDELDQQQQQQQQQQQIGRHRADAVLFGRTQSRPAPLLEQDYIQPVFWGEELSERSLIGCTTRITDPTVELRCITFVMVEFFTEFKLRLAQRPITLPALTRTDVFSDLPGYCMRHDIMVSQRTLLPDPTATPSATRRDLEQHSHWFVQGCVNSEMRFEFPLGPRFCNLSVPREDTVRFGADKGKVYVIEVVVFAGEYNGWGRVGRVDKVDEFRELGCLVNELPEGAERRYCIRVDVSRPKENAWCEYALLQEKWLWQRDLDVQRGVLERREGVYPVGGSVQLEKALNAGPNTPFLTTSADEPVHPFDKFNHFAIHLHHNSEMCRQHAASSSTPTTPCTAEDYDFHVDLSITNSTVTNLNSATLPGLTTPSTSALQQQFTNCPHRFLTCKRVDKVGISVGGGVPRDEGGGQVIFQTPLGPRFCEFGPPRPKKPLVPHRIHEKLESAEKLIVGFEMQLFLDAVAALGVVGDNGVACGRFFLESRLEEGTQILVRYAPLYAYLREAWECQRGVDEVRGVADVFAAPGAYFGVEEFAQGGEDGGENGFLEEGGGHEEGDADNEGDKKGKEEGQQEEIKVRVPKVKRSRHKESSPCLSGVSVQYMPVTNEHDLKIMMRRKGGEVKYFMLERDFTAVEFTRMGLDVVNPLQPSVEFISAYARAFEYEGTGENEKVFDLSQLYERDCVIKGEKG
ncbi:hypothetical protein HDU98_003866, partial [Podochytrium sp. JEL0797]